MEGIRGGDIGLITVIVDEGLGSRVLRIAREAGVPYGTVLLGRGTARRGWLDALGLGDTRREVIMLAAGMEEAKQLLEELYGTCRFKKPGGGIAYLKRLSTPEGAKPAEYMKEEGSGCGMGSQHKLIMTIVDKGLGEDVMDAAAAAGAKGGTIVNARGTGLNAVGVLFNTMEIEPEKEMVIILVKAEIAPEVAESIRTRMDIDSPGKGIILMQDVEGAYGIVE